MQTDYVTVVLFCKHTQQYGIVSMSKPLLTHNLYFHGLMLPVGRLSTDKQIKPPNCKLKN